MHIYRVKNPACFLWKFSDFPVVKVVLLLHEGGQYEKGIIIKREIMFNARMMMETALGIPQEICFLFIKTCCSPLCNKTYYTEHLHCKAVISS